jgi:hypothetical protein
MSNKNISFSTSYYSNNNICKSSILLNLREQVLATTATLDLVKRIVLCTSATHLPSSTINCMKSANIVMLKQTHKGSLQTLYHLSTCTPLL